MKGWFKKDFNWHWSLWKFCWNCWISIKTCQTNQILTSRKIHINISPNQKNLIHQISVNFHINHLILSSNQTPKKILAIKSFILLASTVKKNLLNFFCYMHEQVSVTFWFFFKILLLVSRLPFFMLSIEVKRTTAKKKVFFFSCCSIVFILFWFLP